LEGPELALMGVGAGHVPSGRLTLMPYLTDVTTPSGWKHRREGHHFLILRLPFFWLVVDPSNYWMISAQIYS
jgi:hypothetical protein